MNFTISTDVDVNELFRDAIDELHRNFGYSIEVANALATNYYRSFTDEVFCTSIGIPVQDDDFFFHEASRGMAARIHYYLGLKGDPNPRSFIEWRSKAFPSKV